MGACYQANVCNPFAGIAHQILTLVANTRLYNFSALADWSTKPVMHMHSVGYI